MFEVPVLAIVSEVYDRNMHPRARSSRRARGASPAKIEQLNAVPDPEFRIADYGTRRRFSRAWQEEVLRTLKRDGIGQKFVGTSNVASRMRARAHAARHDGARVPAGVPGAWGRGCAIRRCSRSTRGRASTAATSASRCPTCSAWTRSCATSTCSSASCSTACATTRATRSNGARS